MRAPKGKTFDGFQSPRKGGASMNFCGGFGNNGLLILVILIILFSADNGFGCTGTRDCGCGC